MMDEESKEDFKEAKLTIKSSGVSRQFATLYQGFYQTHEGKSIPIVVKELNCSKEDGAAQLAEAERLKRAGSHSNIVKFIGSMISTPESLWAPPNSVWIITKQAEFGSLDEYFSPNSPNKLGIILRLKLLSTPGCVVRIIGDILSGLSHLHNQTPELIHRDIALRNVLWDSEGTGMLCDFGLARDGSKYYQQKSSVPVLQPPEFSEKKRSDIATDMWMVGATIYELIVGRDLGTRPIILLPDIPLIQEDPDSKFIIRTFLPLLLDEVPARRPTAVQALGLLRLHTSYERWIGKPNPGVAVLQEAQAKAKQVDAH